MSARKSAALRVVDEPSPCPPEPAIEDITRECIERRRWLRKELAAEEARLTWLRRRLADERGIKFIRVEALEREFGA